MYVGSLFIVLQDQRLACVHTQSSTGVDTQGPSGISGSSCVNAIVIEPPPKSLESLLKDHAAKFVDDSSEYLLTVDRTTPEKLWIAVVTFYKGAKIRPNKLHKGLVVHFSGEAGADAGALRREFFEDALNEADNRLFEGEINNRVPKKDFGLQMEFEIAGMLLGHSILQEGPSMACLSDSIYHYFISEKADQCFPSKSDIPLNLATHHLITFIEQVHACTTVLVLYVQCIPWLPSLKLNFCVCS